MKGKDENIKQPSPFNQVRSLSITANSTEVDVKILKVSQHPEESGTNHCMNIKWLEYGCGQLFIENIFQIT